ncbi:hypothetical protein [Stutzerimonas stutzeri]|uniref:hypothetical protein n=1 Tax=Stutzerimonas stutzeri TaxID=316 RepID=UPI00265CA450|nr:hypothetical protein [Stutzerimonas stutzeri]MCF6783414.1 hypothetical protein [Stutzerimonas stutzeri]
MQKSIPLPAALLMTSALALASGAGLAYYFKGQPGYDRPGAAQDTQNPCAQVASEEQASALLTRLFPNAKIIAAEPLSLDVNKSSCLLEVEMLADAAKQDSRGFVYVLPDGQRFLNGPLMDKRSKVGLQETTADIGKALEEQKEAIQAIISARPQPQSQPIRPSAVEPELTKQLVGSFPTPTRTAEIPSVDDLRQRLVSQMEGLPSLMTGEGTKVVHVMVDPLCSYCKKLHQDSESLSAQHGVRFNWIPIFLNEGSWAMSALILKELAKDPQEATDLFARMMQGEWAGAEAEASITMLTEEDYAAVKPAAGLFIEVAKSNPRIGTPLVVFERSEGGIEVISGLPKAKDWEAL